MGPALAVEKLSDRPQSLSNGSSAPVGFAVVGAQALFFSRELGLFRSDGTAAGTALVRDLEPRVHEGQVPSVVALGSFGYWVQAGGLWRSDGTGPGTSLVRSVGAAALTAPQVLGGRLYFGVGGSLYHSDGTAAGTQELAVVKPLARGMVVGQQLFFACATLPEGTGLCATDGTAAGTRVVRSGLSSPTDPVILLGGAGDRVVFRAASSQLWASDGTSAGTVRVLPSGTAVSTEAAALGGRLYTPCFTAATGDELCSTDGTVAGTAVLDLTAGTAGTDVLSVAALRTSLVWLSTSPRFYSLWRSDGTVAGSSVIGTASHPGLAAVGGAAYFTGMMDGDLVGHRRHGSGDQGVLARCA